MFCRMRNSRTNSTLASLDDIEKPRDFSDVSLTHFAAEPHNKLGALLGGGDGEGEGGEGDGEGEGGRGMDDFVLIQS